MDQFTSNVQEQVPIHKEYENKKAKKDLNTDWIVVFGNLTNELSTCSPIQIKLYPYHLTKQNITTIQKSTKQNPASNTFTPPKKVGEAK